MPYAVRYHRFSTKRQDKGVSLDRQNELTAALCEKNGWTIIDTLEDKGRSAWKGDHLRVGELGKFKVRVDAGEFEHGTFLVIENLDRLSRQDVKLARRWIEDITDHGIKVAVCSPEIVLDSEALSGSNIVSMVQYLLEAQRSTGESSRKSQMSQKNVAESLRKARNGIVYSARAPMWLRGTKGTKFEVIEERAALVRQIYEWSASGLGYHAIASRLNGSVEPWTKASKKGDGWKVGYIRDILLLPAAEGEYHVEEGGKRTGEVILAYYPRIVDADLVQRARDAIRRRDGTGGAGRREARNLFAGRVKCGHCGDGMVRIVQRNRQKTQYEYLKCTRFNAAGAPKPEDDTAARKRRCTNATMFRYDLFEKAALKEILHLALDNSFFIKTDDISPLAGKVADLSKTVELKEAEQRRLLAFIMKVDDAPEAEEMLEQLRPELRKLKAELEAAQQDLDAAKGKVSPDEHLRRVLEVKEAIYSKDPEEQEQARRKVRDAIQSVVTSVVCYSRPPLPGVKRPEREIQMALAGGYLAYQFDGEGNLLKKISLQGIPDMMRGIAATDGGALVETIRQRRLQAADAETGQ
ncbi:recombinase family protein [Novosphingobium sp. TCA1]|jgi:DNA invertase Pin-like site-specific DNA recombinase|uniref:recombinase family protein n=1 Tax=Novosphingobium sp. TCA1 TaxID=2682474 RepID=UPI00130671D1|nr:recombinase family protein [Novosphingobium sp. TCA1]GFE72400.1 hypothetical protein NTCA1_00490 [Novosphingobium sp. TCA1]